MNLFGSGTRRERPARRGPGLPPRASPRRTAVSDRDEGRAAGPQFTCKVSPDIGRSSVSPRRNRSTPPSLTCTLCRPVLKKKVEPPLTFALRTKVTLEGPTASGVVRGISKTALAAFGRQVEPSFVPTTTPGAPRPAG